jgi:hexosaminidase
VRELKRKFKFQRDHPIRADSGKRAALNCVRFGWTVCVAMALAQMPMRADSPLFARGYTVIPEPQKVVFTGGDFEFNSGWTLKLGSGVKRDDVAVTALEEGLQKRDGIALGEHGRGKPIELAIQPGSVEIGQATDHNRQALETQAYRLELTDTGIRVTANAPTGLFYGVDTLVQ